jgi:hypothetical protein
MLRDPEHTSFFQLKCLRERGEEYQENRASGEKHPLALFFDDFWKSVQTNV